MYELTGNSDENIEKKQFNTEINKEDLVNLSPEDIKKIVDTGALTDEQRDALESAVSSDTITNETKEALLENHDATPKKMRLTAKMKAAILGALLAVGGAVADYAQDKKLNAFGLLWGGNNGNNAGQVISVQDDKSGGTQTISLADAQKKANTSAEKVDSLIDPITGDSLYNTNNTDSNGTYHLNNFSTLSVEDAEEALAAQQQEKKDLLAQLVQSHQDREDYLKNNSVSIMENYKAAATLYLEKKGEISEADIQFMFNEYEKARKYIPGEYNKTIQAIKLLTKKVVELEVNEIVNGHLSDEDRSKLKEIEAMKEEFERLDARSKLLDKQLEEADETFRKLKRQVEEAEKLLENMNKSVTHKW